MTRNLYVGNLFMKNVCVWFVVFYACLTLNGFSFAATITVHTDSKDEVVVEPDVEVTANDAGQAVFTFASDDDVKYLNKPGQPQIPWTIVTILLQPGTDISSVSYSVNDITLARVDGEFEIVPAPLIKTWDDSGNSYVITPEEGTIMDGRDVEIYEVDDFWPTQDAQIFQKGKMRQWKLVEIAVPLVKYNPVTGKLQEVVSADIDITYEKKLAAGKTNQVPHKHWKKQADRVKSIAKNFDEVVAAYESLATDDSDSEVLLTGVSEADSDDYAAASTESNGYAIITTDAIVSNSTKLSAFVTHKERLGWDVMVLTESDWGGGTGTTAYNNLHTWLQNNYLTEDLLYVLLVGTPYTDTGTVPMLMYTDAKGDAPTDFFYSSFTGDAYWEVAVGRIPYYDDITNLDSILQKFINYENSTDTLWRNNAIIGMARLDKDTPLYECGEQMKERILDPLSIDSDRIYESDFDVSPEYKYSSRYLGNLWEDDTYGLVFWGTHGSQVHAEYFIGTWDVADLNDDYPSIVYQGSCLNGYPENSGNLGYTILKNGAVATVASTRNTYYSVAQTWYPSDWCMGGLGYRYLDEICTEEESVGVAWSNARQSNTYGPCRYRQTLYGDPSISLTFSPMLAAHYKFDGDAEDSSGNNYDGTIGGAPTYTDGHVGQAMSFDGVNDHVTLPEGIDSRDITVAAWVYWNGGSSNQQIFDFGNDTSEYMFLTPENSGGSLRFAISDDGVTQEVTASELVSNQWVHVTVTLNGDTATLYVDGAAVASNTSVTINPSDFNPTNNYIGTSQFTGHPNFSGLIDDFRIYNYALTADEVAALTLSFTSNSFANNDGVELKSYSGQSLTNFTNSSSDTLVYSKVSGPDWLKIDSDGTLSGMPKAADVDENVFTVKVRDTDCGQYHTAEMTIEVENVFNGTQGLEDLLGIASEWLTLGCSDCDNVDLDGDSNVGGGDFAILAHNWLISEDLQLNLQFDETEGDVANDNSMFFRNGTLYNDPTWETGYSGSALSFDGSNYVQVANDDGLEPGASSFSIAFWMKSDTPSQGALIISKRYASSPYQGYLIGLSSGSPTTFPAGSKLTYLIGSGTGQRKGGYTADNIEFSDWTHVCVVMDQDTDSVQIYINGVAADTAVPLDNTIANITTSTPVYIGKYPGVSSKPFNGSIDDVRIYNMALTQEQVESLLE